jgi:hypothetical protein
VNSEPKGDSGSGQPGEGGNLSQTADATMRGRKPGVVGGMSGSTGGGNLSENEDASMRSRKSGKVGMSKAQMIELGLSESQMALAAEMGFAKGYKKANGEEEDMEEEEEEEYMEMGKGEITEDDLNKSLDALEAIALGSTIPAPQERRAELANRLNAGTLTKAEMTELSWLMKAGGADEAADELIKSGEAAPAPEEEEAWESEMNKSWQEQFSEDPTAREAYDASQFLERQSQLIAAALDQTQGSIRKSLRDQEHRKQTFDVALAKSLRGMASMSARQASLLKSITDRLETVENQPLPRRGVTGIQQLRKAMPNEAGGGDGRASRKQILDTLEGMARMRERSANGERLDYAVTLYEQHGDISKSLYHEVVEELRKSGNGVGIH